MKKGIYNAAATGDVNFLLEEAFARDVEAAVAVYSNDDLCGLTSHGNNIIHVAAEHGHLDFIKLALKRFSSAHQTKLLCGTNKDGDTPLHLAAKLPISAMAEYLIEATPASSGLWRAKNKKDNTPLHVALMNGGKSIQVAAYLLKLGPEVASYANCRKETPLHLAVDYNTQGLSVSNNYFLHSILLDTIQKM
ncbi:E3 ubiquitin-protein ligase MIB1 [Bienertia sinuspersici]